MQPHKTQDTRHHNRGEQVSNKRNEQNSHKEMHMKFRKRDEQDSNTRHKTTTEMHMTVIKEINKAATQDAKHFEKDEQDIKKRCT